MGRDPRQHMTGSIFPPATVALGLTSATYGGSDAGDGVHTFDARLRHPTRFGRDTLDDGNSVGAQASPPAWGMLPGAAESYRARYLVTRNRLRSVNVPLFRGRMRPAAVAVHPRTLAGEIPPQPSTGRQVAAGRVTRWEQASLVWPEYGGPPRVVPGGQQ